MRISATSSALLVVSVAIIVGLKVWGFHGLRHDDAFISFRYAQNLVEGHGLVFNPGERMMGSTAPGHVILAAALYRIVGLDALPSVMSAIGCLAWLLQGVAVAALLRRALEAQLAWLIGAAVVAGVAYAQRFVALETNLVAAAVLVALAAAVWARWGVATVAAAVAMWMRPDAMIAVLPLSLLCLHDRRWQAWKYAAIGALLILPWVLFAWIYFGSPWPQSAAAKIGDVPFRPYTKWLLNYPMNLLRWRLTMDGLNAWQWRAGVVWLLAGVGSVALVWKNWRLVVLPATLALYVLAYVNLRAGAGMEWHLYPVLLYAGVLALAAFSVLLPRRIAAAVLALVIAVVTVRTAQYARVHEDAYWYGARDRAYRSIAEKLLAVSAPGEWVVSDEVGTIAYYARRPVIDLAGLVTGDPKARVAALGPRWYVLLPAFRTRDVYALPGFAGPAIFSTSAPSNSEEIGIRRAASFDAILIDASGPALFPEIPEPVSD